MPVKQEVADSFTGHWQIGLCETPCKAPVSFCYGCCCSCCMTCQQRLEILDVIGEKYVCCGGLFPCGPLGEEQDRNCIFLETCCCPGLALSANRFLIQTRFDRENTFCDDCLMWSVCLASWAVCILHCVGCDVPDEIENLVDCARMTVQGCMLGQQQAEVDYIKKTGYGGPSRQIMAVMSPQQVQMMQQAKLPPQYHMGAAGGAAVVGAVIAGGAGAAAMGGAFGGGRPAQQAMRGSGARGFMATIAPNGRTWANFCGTQQPMIDNTGFVNGPWGQCIAWSKVFEYQNPSWPQMPEYREDGPTGQVIQAMLTACPRHMRQSAENAANNLETACDQAAALGRNLPIINQRA